MNRHSASQTGREYLPEPVKVRGWIGSTRPLGVLLGFCDPYAFVK